MPIKERSAYSGKEYICLSVEDDADEMGTQEDDDPTNLALDKCMKHLKSSGNINEDDRGSNASTLHPKSYITLHHHKDRSNHLAPEKFRSGGTGRDQNHDSSPSGSNARERFYELSFNNSQHFMLGGNKSSGVGHAVIADEENTSYGYPTT